MLRVGLTGGLASGKSFAAAEFERLGCAVAHADELGRKILEDDAQARERVASEFGSAVLAASGAIDRKALASVVFADESSLERLNAIIHPRVFEHIEGFFRDIEARDPEAVAIVEAAIMIETGSWKRYDRIVLAACPRETQIERFVRREGATRQEAESRIARQMSLDEKRRHADFVIDTGGSEERTLEQVRDVWRALRSDAAREAGSES